MSAAVNATVSQTSESAEAPAEQPLQVLFRVERGDPSPEEVAALSVVVAALAWGGEPEPEPAAKRRGWGSRWQVLRPRMMRGHGWGGR